MFVLPFAFFVVLADAPKPIDPAAFDRLVIDALRDVHNRGASLYNEGKDYAGCFRMYEGSLRTVRPLLAHRPAVQKRIDDDLAKLGDDETVRAKAFRLHELIETVRGELRDGAVKPVESKPIQNAPHSPTPVPLTTVPAKPVAIPAWSGIVSLAGKPLSGAEVTFVSLELAEPKVVSSETNANGRVRVVLPAFGRYAMMVTGPGVPERYATTTASGLRTDVRLGSDEGTINLNEK